MQAYPLAEMDPKLKEYLEEVKRREMAKSNPEYQMSQGQGNIESAQLQNNLGLLGALGKSFAQIGTYRGKTPDASPAADFAKELQGKAAADDAARMAREKQGDQDLEGRGKLYQYLQDRIDKNNSEQNRLAFDAKKMEDQAKLDAESAKTKFDYQKQLEGIEQKNRKDLAKITKPEKEPSQQQYKDAGFARRLENNDEVFSNLEKEGFDRSSTLQGIKSMSPLNILKGGNLQSQEQAERDFINAVLRNESGASISPAEFASAEKQYFPRAGDTPQVLEQKRANRRQKMEEFRSAAGPAYEKVQRISINPIKNPVSKGDAVASPKSFSPGEIREKNGKKYQRQEDGTWRPING